MTFDGLIALGFTEEDLAVRFDLTYAEVRRQLTEPDPALSAEAAYEMALTRTTETREALAKKYKTTLLQVDKALYRPESIKPVVSDLDIINAWITDSSSSVESISRRFRLSPKKVTDVLLSEGIIREGDTPPRSKQVAAMFMLIDGAKYEVVARTLGLALSTVYCYASMAGLARPQVHNRLAKETWDELLGELNKGASVSDLSRQYKVSRAAIYRQLKLK